MTAAPLADLPAFFENISMGFARNGVSSSTVRALTPSASFSTSRGQAYSSPTSSAGQAAHSSSRPSMVSASSSRQPACKQGPTTVSHVLPGRAGGLDAKASTISTTDRKVGPWARLLQPPIVLGLSTVIAMFLISPHATIGGVPGLTLSLNLGHLKSSAGSFLSCFSGITRRLLHAPRSLHWPAALRSTLVWLTAIVRASIHAVHSLRWSAVLRSAYAQSVAVQASAGKIVSAISHTASNVVPAVLGRFGARTSQRVVQRAQGWHPHLPMNPARHLFGNIA
mmetsp:Transcript_13043/g.37297  ORF Transcript_13043/g.37297 Transcript_13043/m.37297 type:complete len:281 (-) Transcript_13043:719-1561(-)